MTLATQKTLLDVLVSIEWKLVTLGWAVIDQSTGRLAVVTEPRVLKWAIAICLKAGVAESFLIASLEKSPPERHWRIVRTHLPESALHVLDGKLDTFLLDA